MAQDGVHRRQVNLIRIAGLDTVLDEGFESEYEIFEALDLLYLFQEGAHRTLVFGQFHLAVLLPEVLVAHLGIYILLFTALALEQLFGQLVEAIVRQARGTDDDDPLQKRGKLQFANHVVARQHPLAVGQLLKVLFHTQVLDEVDVGTLWYGQFAAPDVVAGILQDV